MRIIVFLLMVLSLILVMSACVTLFKPVQIEDRMVNHDEVVMFDLRDYTSSQNVDAVQYDVVSGVGSIEAGHYYRWRADFYTDGGSNGVSEVTVRATNERGRHREDTFAIVVNRIPHAPVLIPPSPKDGEENTEWSVRLSWSSYDPDVECNQIDDFLKYDLYFGTDDDPPLLRSGITHNFLTVDDLEYGRTYFWQVVVKDRNSAVEGDVWSFTTRAMHSLTIEVIGKGLVEKEVIFDPLDTSDYPHETEIKLTAIPEEDWELQKWTVQTGEDEEEFFGIELEIIMDADKIATAVFVLKTYTITVVANPEDGGEIEGAGTYEHGEEIELTAIPNEGYLFLNWTEDTEVVGTEDTLTFIAEEDRELVANFERKSHTITATVEPEDGGTVNNEVLFQGTYQHGDEVILEAEPSEGYEFVSWTESGEVLDEDNPYVFEADSDRNVVANFAWKSYTITATAGEGGSIDPEGEVVVEHGEDQSFTITPDEGYMIADVQVDGESVLDDLDNSTYTFEDVQDDHTIHAVFSKKVYTITATVSPKGAGTVNDVETFTDTYEHGETVSLEAVAEDGFVFARWEEDGTEVADGNMYEFTAVQNRELTAHFDSVD